MKGKFSMHKRIISMLLIFCMVLSVSPASALAAERQGGQTVAAVSNPFNDVSESAWYYEAVMHVYANSFFSGTTPDTFEPDGSMTRAMFVTVLGRMAGVDTAAYQNEQPFADVAPDTYYAPYVAWAARHGIAQGTGEGKFSPHDKVTRQQMAVFFVKYFENFGVEYSTGQNITGEPADLSRVADWARAAVLKLWAVGLLNGDGQKFNPESSATRAECAMICFRADKAVKLWYSEPHKTTNPTTPTNPAKPTAPTTGGGGSGSGGGSNSGNYAVKFYDGNQLIDTLYAKRGEALGAVPSVGKSSKANAILVGYFTDAACEQPFYAENPVTADMNVYAKYENLGEPQEITIDSFARMDVQPNVTFTIKRISGNVPLNEAATLVVKDGSEPVQIQITGSEAAATVSAPEGFNPGCSYELNLAEGWVFVVEDYPEVDTIRTAAFSIFMEEVDNLQMNDDIKYIQDTPQIDYTINNQEYEVLTMTQMMDSDGNSISGGTFNYAGGDLAVGDVICVYVGTHPEERDFDRSALAPAIYVKVTDVNGGTVSFAPLGVEDQQAVYEVPDNFPLQVSALPTGEGGTANISNLDADIYAQMLGIAEADASTDALAKIAAGDFVSLYVDANAVGADESGVYFGRITAFDVATGAITYTKSSSQEILDSMDLYVKAEISGDDLLTEEEKAEIEAQVLAQVQASDFGEEAAYLLADMVTRTDGFRENMNVRDFLLTDENGRPLSDEEIQLLNLGGSFELADDVELKVELNTSGDQMHFANSGSVQLAIGVKAEFEVEAEDGSVHIDLSATFVEEVAVDPSVKGEVVYKKILKCIPIPTGVQINANIDVRNFTAMSLAAEIYTEAAEDEGLWEQFKKFTENPSELKNIPGLPADLQDKVKTVGEAMEKIEELKGKIDKAVETAEQLQGYAEDIEQIWSVIQGTNPDYNEEEWQGLCEALGKTSVAEDLMDMLNMTTDTGLSVEYLEDMQALMDKYSEMLEKETDWVKLVDKEMFNQFYHFKGVGVGVQGRFIVRADMNICIGSNLEYEVGKRYSFWFKVGLFKPSSGSSTMDLLDEHFAFQFYVMGKIGIKAGVRLKLYAAIGGVDAISAGVTTELGPYLKLWGFFIYDYSKYRQMNTSGWVSKQRMAGAVCLEFGLYLMVGVEAKALFLEYEKDFVDEEYPLLKAGDERYYYDAAYEPEEGEVVRVINTSPDGVNPASMVLPDELRALKYVDLTTGRQGEQALDYSNYNFTLSNPNFRLDIAPDNKSAKIVVTNIPANTRYMPCDLTITYKHGKMAFSDYDMTATVPLVWTNMTDADLAEFYTATVRVPAGDGSYTGVWSKRVRKNTAFDLPDVAAIKKLLSWNDLKYAEGRGYGSQQIEGLTIIDNTAYDFDIAYQTYTLTVNGVQNVDGSTESRTYTAKYGEAFDFSDLWESGANVSSPANYTKFAGLTLNGENFDLNRTVNGRLAQALQGGATAQAQYVDDSAEVTFSFTFVNTDKEVPKDRFITVRKGDTPDLTVIQGVWQGNGLVMTDISPAVGAVYGDTVYQVVCEQPQGEEKTVTFDVNGGDALSAEQASKKVAAGSLAGTLPTPTRTGYTFGGWFTDKDTFANEFTANSAVTADITVYAKWTETEKQTITVTFNVNGGNKLAENTKTVTVGEAYGALPTPEHADARYAFLGWFTAPDGGEEIGATTIVSATANQTLYAHWAVAKTIPREVFAFGEQETYTYEKGVAREVIYTYDANAVYEASKDTESGEYALASKDLASLENMGFTFRYKRQDDNLLTGNDYLPANELPVGAGTYDVTVSRPAGGAFAKFEETYTDVVLINRATRDLSGNTMQLKLTDSGFTYLQVEQLSSDIDDLHESAQIACVVSLSHFPYGDLKYIFNDGFIYDLGPGKEYTIESVVVMGDPNYEDAEAQVTDSTFKTKDAPTDSWFDYADTSWYDDSQSSFEISTAEQFAGLSKLVEESKSFKNKTVTLTADIDLSAHQWEPIGNKDFFYGVFDGGGHTIKGACITEYSNEDNIGLFGAIAVGYYNDGETIPVAIKNLTLDDSYFGYLALTGYKGILIGLAKQRTQNLTGTIENCTSNGVSLRHEEPNDFVLYLSDAKQRYMPAASQNFDAEHEEGILNYINCTARPLPTVKE